MKKNYLSKWLLLLCALVAGSGTVWAAEVTYAVTSTSAVSATGTAPDGSTASYSSTYTTAYQLIKDKSMTLTLSGYYGYKITNITLEMKSNSGSGSGNLSYSIDNGSTFTDIISTAAFNTSSWYGSWSTSYVTISKNVTIIPTTSALKIKIAATANSLYCKSFKITYEVNKTLSSISLSGTYPTSFTEQDAFSHEGMTVTANYEDSSTKDVTSSATFTGYDMNTIGEQTVTVSYTEGSTTKTQTYGITVNAGPKYTVTFNAETGTCGTPSSTEEIYKGGVTLPSATCTYSGWTLAGWATSASSSTNVKPTVYKAGSTYKPTSNITLHAVYTLSDFDGDKYKRATALSQITSANSVVFVNNSKALDANLGSVSAPTETEGLITPANGTVWSLSGNNTQGFELTTTSLTTNKKLGVSSIPTSSANVSLTDNNSKWLFETYTGGTNMFVLKNVTGPSDNTKVGVLEYTNSNWKYYVVAKSTYNSSNTYTKSKVYVPVESRYNSNPTADIVNPTMAFTNSDTHTFYLDGTTTYTNAANLTGVDKSITYTSSNTDVAEVSSTGVVTAKAIGTATITASIDAELGVHNAAFDTYTVVVKSTNTISGIKALSSDATEVNFTADLTDAKVTYSDVAGKYAYIQDASAAIMVYITAGHGLTAGKKINGAVSGKVKAPYTIDQISSITVTGTISDAEIPAAETKTLAQIVANAASLDGKKVIVNAATITDGGEKITDDGGTTSLTLTNPNSVTVNETEIGNLTGFVSTYVNGENVTYRLNIYEASHYQKTQNVTTAQTLTFDDNDVQLDEVTDALTSYAGQTVNGAHTTVTWSKMDADGIIDEFNTTTGELTLTGACGTATITASAAAENIVVAGVTTPYTAAEQSYTITVNPRYIVTFSVNGVETIVRQATSGATITAPTPATIGDYHFIGWKTTTIDPTDDKPTIDVLGGATITPAPTNNEGKYYAVYAQILPENISTITDELTRETTGVDDATNGTVAYESWSDITVTSDAVYAGQSAGDNNSIQLRSKNSNSGIITTTSGGNIKKVTIEWNSANTNGKTLDIYGKNTAYSAVSDLYGSASGTKLGSIVCGTSTELTVTGNYTFVGLRSNDGAIYLDKVSIKWEVETPTGYCTSFTANPSAPVVNGETVTLTTSENMAGWRTFYDANKDYEVDANTTIYVVQATSATANVVELTALEATKIPAAAPVILKTTATDRQMTLTVTTNAASLGTNLLSVTDGTSDANGYRLGYNATDGVAFYPYTATAPTAGIVYLASSNVNTGTGDARGLRIIVNEATGIAENEIMRNVENEKVYNLSGQRVDNPKKGGLYIVNGKKVIKN